MKIDQENHIFKIYSFLTGSVSIAVIWSLSFKTKIDVNKFKISLRGKITHEPIVMTGLQGNPITKIFTTFLAEGHVLPGNEA